MQNFFVIFSIIAIANVISFEFPPKPLCQNEIITCKESKCANCTAFINCCNDQCSKRPPAIYPELVSRAKFVCEDDGNILDCKCSADCFKEALEYQKAECNTSEAEETFHKCCREHCPKQEPVLKIKSSCDRNNHLLPTCRCEKFRPTTECAGPFANCVRSDYKDCRENDHCCAGYCILDGYDGMFSDYIGRNPYCTCALQIGSFGFADKLFSIPANKLENIKTILKVVSASVRVLPAYFLTVACLLLLAI